MSLESEEVKLMIQVEMCRGCGRPLFIHRVANLVVRLETDTLDGQGAVEALMAGRELWRVTATDVKPAKPAVLATLTTAEPGERPHVAQEHRCTAVSGPGTPSAQSRRVDPKVEPQTPTQRLAAPPTPPSAQRTAVSGARRAGRRASSPYVNVVCEVCHVMVGREPRVGVQWGDRWMWVIHDRCSTQPK